MLYTIIITKSAEFYYAPLLSALNYKHFSEGRSRVEHSLTFPGNLHTSAYVLDICVCVCVCTLPYTCVHGSFPLGLKLKQYVELNRDVSIQR